MCKIKKMLAAVCLTLMSFIMIVGCSCVKEEVDELYSITLNVANSEHGTIKSNKTEAEKGEVIIITPEAKRGYVIDYIKVDDVACALNKSNQCEFTMPKKDISVSASFKEADAVQVEYQYDQTAVALEGASSEYYVGENITFKLKTKLAYKVDNVKIGNTELTKSNDGYNYTIPEGVSKVTILISTSWDDSLIKVSFSGVPHATVKEEDVYFQEGAVINLADYFVLDEGYGIVNYIRNGVSIGSNNEYTVTSDGGTISLVVVKLTRISFVAGVDHAVSKKPYEYEYKAPGSIINLDDYFTFDEGYVADYYLINGTPIEGNSYTVGTTAIGVSLVTVKGVKIIFESVEHATAKQAYKYYKEGTTINIEDCFDFDEGYGFNVAKINGYFVGSTKTHTVGTQSATISLQVIKLPKIEFTAAEHATVKQAYIYKRVGTEINLADCFEIEEGYVLDKYIINGAASNDGTYTVGTADATISIVVKLVKTSFAGVDHVTVKDSSVNNKVGTVIDLTKQFEIEEGYLLEYYTVNGEEIDGTIYTVGMEDATISLVVVKGVKVNYTGVEHATANDEYVYYKEGTVLNVSELFTFDEGYVLDYYTVNGQTKEGTTYAVTNEEVTISLAAIVGYKVTYVGLEQATAKTESVYYKEGTVLQLPEFFEVDERYAINSFVVNGEEIQGTTYTVTAENVPISLVLENAIQINILSSSQHVEVKDEYVYVKKGTVVNLRDYFEIKDGYVIDYYLVNDGYVGESTYTVVKDITLEAVVDLVGITYILVDNVSVDKDKNQPSYAKVGDVLPLVDFFTVASGYVIDYYIVNGERVEGTTYTVGDQDAKITISLKVSEGILIRFSGVPYAAAVYEEVYFKEGAIIDLSKYFGIVPGYGVTNYIRNGTSIGSSNKYRVTSAGGTISLVVAKTQKITFVGVARATAKQEFVNKVSSSVLNLDDYFELYEGYHVHYYTVDGVRYEGHTLTNFVDSTVSLVVAEGGTKITYTSEEHATAMRQSSSYKVGRVLNLDCMFEVELGYLLDYYTVNGEKIEGNEYTVTNDAVTISLVTIKSSQVTYKWAENTKVVASSHVSKVGTVLNLDECFTINEGYLLEYYTVNGEKIEGNTYTLTDQDATISVVTVKGIKITFKDGTNAEAKQPYAYYRKGETINLDDYFDVDDTYVIAVFFANTTGASDRRPLSAREYKVGDNDTDITFDTIKGNKITFVSSDHATAKIAYIHIIDKININLDNYFNFEEGYVADYYKVNGVQIEGNTINGASEATVEVVLVSGTKVNYVGVEHTTAKFATKYYKEGTELNLESMFVLDEHYVVDYYTINGERIEGTTYTVTSTDVNVSLVVSEWRDITYTAAENTTVSVEKANLKVGTVLNLDECFTINEGYLFEYYTVNGERINGTTYTVVSGVDATISVVVVQAIKVTYVGITNAPAVQEYEYYREGTSIDLEKQFTIKEGYNLSRYLLNGSTSGITQYYIVGTQNVTISLEVYELVKVTFVGVDHGLIKEEFKYINPGSSINLNDCFSIEEDYEVVNFTVNGTGIEGTTYRVGTSNVTISLVVAEVSNVTYNVPENVTLKATSGTVRVGTLINLEECFEIEKGYVLYYYTIDGTRVEESTYTVGANDVTISIVVKLIQVTYMGTDHAPAIHESESLKVGTVLNLDECFEIEEGYLLDYYTVNDEKINGTTYTVGTSNVFVSIVVKLVQVTYTGVEHAPAKNTCASEVTVGTVFDLNECFEIEEGYLLDYYTVNDEKINGTTYTVGTSNVFVSIVVKLVQVTYTGVEHAPAKNANASVKVGTVINLNECFEIETGYELDYYTVNGTRVEGTNYTVGSDNVTISVVVAELSNVTYIVPSNVTLKTTSGALRVGTEIKLEECFEIESGYELDYYTVNGAKVEGTRYTVGSNDVIISLVIVELSAVNYAVSQHATLIASNAILRVGTEINLSECYEIETGYVLDHYEANGSRINGSKYIVASEDVTISIVVKLVAVTYTGVEHASATNTCVSEVKAGTEISLSECFEIAEGYALSYYKVNGTKITGTTYTVGTSDVTVSLVVEKMGKLHFVSYSPEATVKQASAYVKKGTSVNLNDYYEINEGYSLAAYLLEGEEISGNEYVATDEEVTLSIVLIKLNKLEFTNGENATRKYEYKYFEKDDSIDLNSYYDIDDTHVLDYYTVNGEKINGTTYTVGTSDVTISIVTRLVKVTYLPVANVSVKNESVSVTAGTEIDLAEQFVITEGYLLEYYTVNGNRVDGSTYTVGKKDLIISVIVVQGIRITYAGDTNAPANQSYAYYKQGTEIDLEKQFTIKEGYALSNYLYDGYYMETSKVIINRSAQFSINVYKLTKVTFVGVDHIEAKQGYAYYNVGTVLNLEDCFNVEKGYEIKTYKVDNNPITGTTYTITSSDVSISLEVQEGTRVNYVTVDNVTVDNSFAIKVPGTVLNLEEIFAIKEGYFLEYYTVNGNRVDGSTYTVGDEEVTLSLVIVKGTKVIFDAVEHTKTNKTYSYYRVGANIDLGAQFELDEGYKVSRYLLNGLTLGVTDYYTVGSQDVSISLEVYRLTKVTFVGVDHGLANESYAYYSSGTKLELDELFDIDEGYEVLTYKVNNNPISGNTYTVISSDVSISLEVLEGTRVNYASIDNVVVSKSFTINMPGTVINLAEQFTIAEGYFLEYYTVNGNRVDGSTYTVGDEEVTLSLVIVKGTKVSYTAVSNTTAKASYVYYRVGTQIDLAEQFEIAEGYKLTRYLLNGSTLGVTDYYTVGSQDVSISLEVYRLTKITFVKESHVDVTKEYIYCNAGTVINLNEQFTIETGYMLNTYRVNGTSISGTTYTVGSNDATIVAKVFKSSDITFVSSANATAKQTKRTVKEGTVINLGAYFKVESGYIVDHFIVNGKPMIDSSYTVGSDDVTVTIVVRLIKVTYKGVEHATPVNATVAVKNGTVINLNEQFTIDEGYKLSYYTVNESKITSSIYTVTNKNVEFSLVLEKLTKVNFVDTDSTSVKLSHKYAEKGETIDLTIGHNIEEGYVLDYYTVNGERIEGTTYVLTADEINVSVVTVQGVKVNFVSISQKVTVRDEYIYVKEGTTLDVTTYFEVAEGYKINYYVVNGAKGYGDAYTVGSEEVTISIVIAKVN